MSHVAKVDIMVPGAEALDALEAILPQFGLELRRNKKTWNWYGQFLNDWNNRDRAAIFDGWDPTQFGHGDHAIGIKGDPSGYEIGLVPRRDGGVGWEMLYDSFGSGQALERAAGAGLAKLKDELAASIASRHLIRKGYRVHRTVDAKTGAIRLHGRK